MNPIDPKSEHHQTQATEWGWSTQSVLIAPGNSPIAAILAAYLLRRGARVTLLFERLPLVPVHYYCPEICRQQLYIVRGRCDDRIRLPSLLAVHEITLVCLWWMGSRVWCAVREAIGHYNCQIPVILAAEEDDCPAAGLGHSHYQPRWAAAVFGELFGPIGLGGGRIVPQAIAAISGESRPASAETPKDLVFVEDAARAWATLAAATAKGVAHGVYRFRSGWTMNSADVVAQLQRLLGGQSLAAVPPPPDNPLGWKPEISLDVALRLAWDAREADHTPALRRHAA